MCYRHCHGLHTQRLLHSTGYERLCSASPYFRVVKDASEVEVSDARAASELYLKAAVGEGR